MSSALSSMESRPRPGDFRGTLSRGAQRLAASLGDALYGFGLVLAVPLLLLSMVEAVTLQPAHWFLADVFGFLGGAAWLIGKGSRFVLAATRTEKRRRPI